MSYEVTPGLSNAEFIREIKSGGRGSSLIEGQTTIADMQKDMSAKGPNNSSHPLIVEILSELTGVDPTDHYYKEEVKNYVEGIMLDEGGFTKESLPVYKQGKKAGSNYKKLDDFFGVNRVNVFHDAGLSPDFLINTHPAQQHIKVQTGANMFDEGPGGKGLSEPYETIPEIGQNIHFGPDIMREFGFRNLDVQISRDGGVYTLTITYTPGSGRSPWTMIKRRTVDNRDVADDPNYFAGNNTKNHEIERMLKAGRNDKYIEEIEKWLVAKALGDLLQVLLLLVKAILLMLKAIAAGVESQKCLGFSCDTVYSSRLLKFAINNAGCVYQSPGKNKDESGEPRIDDRISTDGIVTCTLYYPGNEEADAKEKRILTSYKKLAIEHNNTTIIKINVVLTKGSIHAGGRVDITSPRVALFRAIINAIERANATIGAVTHSPDGNHDGRMARITEHKALELFKMNLNSGGLVSVLPKMYRLFINGSASGFDPILHSGFDLLTLISKSNLRSILDERIVPQLQKGGGGEADPATHEIYEYTRKLDTNIDEDVYTAIIQVFDRSLEPGSVTDIIDQDSGVPIRKTYEQDDLAETIMSQLEPYFNHFNIAITDYERLAPFILLGGIPFDGAKCVAGMPLVQFNYMLSAAASGAAAASGGGASQAVRATAESTAAAAEGAGVTKPLADLAVVVAAVAAAERVGDKDSFEQASAQLPGVKNAVAEAYWVTSGGAGRVPSEHDAAFANHVADGIAEAGMKAGKDLSEPTADTLGKTVMRAVSEAASAVRGGGGGAARSAWDGLSSAPASPSYAYSPLASQGTLTFSPGGGARKSRKNKSRKNKKNQTRKTNNHKYNRRTRRRHH